MEKRPQNAPLLETSGQRENAHKRWLYCSAVSVIIALILVVSLVACFCVLHLQQAERITHLEQQQTWATPSPIPPQHVKQFKVTADDVTRDRAIDDRHGNDVLQLIIAQDRVIADLRQEVTSQSETLTALRRTVRRLETRAGRSEGGGPDDDTEDEDAEDDDEDAEENDDAEIEMSSENGSADSGGNRRARRSVRGLKDKCQDVRRCINRESRTIKGLQKLVNKQVNDKVKQTIRKQLGAFKTSLKDETRSMLLAEIATVKVTNSSRPQNNNVKQTIRKQLRVFKSSLQVETRTMLLAEIAKLKLVNSSRPHNHLSARLQKLEDAISAGDSRPLPGNPRATSRRLKAVEDRMEALSRLQVQSHLESIHFEAEGPSFNDSMRQIMRDGGKIVSKDADGEHSQEGFTPNDKHYKFWNIEYHSQNNTPPSFLHISDNRDFYTIEESGIYFIYAQILFHDMSGRWAFGVYVDDDAVAQCTTSQPLQGYVQSLPDRNTPNHGVYVHCDTTITVRIEGHQRVSIRGMYQGRVVVAMGRSTFWGIVKLSGIKSKVHIPQPLTL